MKLFCAVSVKEEHLYILDMEERATIFELIPSKAAAFSRHPVFPLKMAYGDQELTMLDNKVLPFIVDFPNKKILYEKDQENN